MKNISISEKLILYFVCLGIVIIAITGTYTYYLAKDALLSRTFDQLISLRMEKKKRLEQFFADRIRDLEFISTSDEVLELIENGERNSNFLHSRFNSRARQFLGPQGYFKKLYVADFNEIKLEIADETPGSPGSVDSVCTNRLMGVCKRIQLEKKVVIRDVSKSELVIYIGAPVFNKEKLLVGMVALEIPISAINLITFGPGENNGLGKTGETYLVGSDLWMRSNSRFEENAVLNIKVNSEAVNNAFKGITATGIIKDYRNIRCLSSYSKMEIEGLNWVVLAEIDEKEAMIPVYAIRNSILLLSVIIAGCVFVFAMLVARRISQPIKRLQRASEQIGERNYNVDLKVTSQDEIGLLTLTFNEMSQRLKIQDELLEEEKLKSFNAIIDAQEMERQRLSRDLHDGLGQSLLAVKIKLEQAKDANAEKKHQILDEALLLLKNSIDEIRHISSDLMPPVLEAFGIELALKTLCKETTGSTGILIKFISRDIPNNLIKRLQIYLYRIVQEAIQNIIKHSESNAAVIEIFAHCGYLLLHVTDDGKGFNPEKPDKAGNGILNIKKRVEMLKGTCSFESAMAKGTRINIKIPIFEI